MTGYLVQVSKERKKGGGMQAQAQRGQGQAAKTGKSVIVDLPVHGPPDLPAKTIPRKAMSLTSPKVLVPAGALLATGAGGAYLYQRKRVEKSLSLMQHDFPSVMMRTP